eukprot:Ihof_evm1s1281 gene=Ihof_evmTU1s1281
MTRIFARPLIALLIYLFLQGSVNAQRCVNNVAENVAASIDWTKRGLYGRYYPFLEYRVGRPWGFPATLNDLHFDRVDNDTGWNFILEEYEGQPLEDFGLAGVDVKKNSIGLIDQLVVSWTGRINLPCTGMYQFMTANDDGIVILINDEEVVTDWNTHLVKNMTGKAVTYQAGQFLPITIEYFQNTGGQELQIYWDPPGPTGWELIPSKYMVPSQGPGIIAIPNVLKLTADSGVQTFCVHLAEKPAENVRVDVNNAIGSDMFGFDKCALFFTPDNWETDQCIKAAIKPIVLYSREVKGNVPIFLNATSKQPSYNLYSAIQAIDPGAIPGFTPTQCSLW